MQKVKLLILESIVIEYRDPKLFLAFFAFLAWQA